MAEDHGFSTLEQAPPYELLPGYTVPFIPQEGVTTIAAGIIGVLVVAGVGYGVARTAGRKTHDHAEAQG